MKKNQDGIVSLIVVMVMMAVISVLVVGFARISQREAKQALNNQLSVQAYYAAETGINDAISSINRSLAPTGPPVATPTDTSCYNDANNLPGVSYSPVLDGGSGVEYSCVLVKTILPNLSFDKQPANAPRVFPIQSNTGAAGSVDAVKISWQDPTPDSSIVVSGCPTASPPTSLPPSLPVNCEVGMLEVDVVPIHTSGGTNPDRAYLNSNTFKVYFTPASAGGSVNFDTANNSQIVAADCSSVATYKCSGSIRSLPAAEQYMVRVVPLYRSANLWVTASGGAATTNLVGAQAIVDATGKANDVVHRIQVYVPLVPNVPYPQFTGTICKRFMVVPDTSASIDTSNSYNTYPECQFN